LAEDMQAIYQELYMHHTLDHNVKHNVVLDTHVSLGQNAWRTQRY